MKRVVVYGAGGHGKVVMDILERDPEIEIAGWLDDNPNRYGEIYFSHPILGGIDCNAELMEKGIDHALVAIGNNGTRDRVACILAKAGFAFVTGVHPSARLGRGVLLGSGSVLMANVVVNADTVIGDHAIVNTGATVDHDCRLGRATHIGPGTHVAGGVTIGDLALIGIGASILPGLQIGHRAIVGAGAAVIADVADDVVVAGVPARPVKGAP